ncbi:hypothetical protein VHEMI08625 [[Torrubiella] hemipterigena]|uniref:FAD-binding PCMH-type domain-containing protein n=1 Tax=[Torrubiella] hemipterigena TaxID=1531966 RepID=A0A0A1TNI7_9HYPO|nr:hypothetical protein VHEMI08625 [[Torrubiella] hemipterigena]
MHLLTLATTLSMTASCCAAQCPDTIDKLNKTLHGRIQRNEPFALPCFSSFEGQPIARDENACAERQANYQDPLYRHQFPGAYMYDWVPINLSDSTATDQCLLDPSNLNNSQAWQGRDCKLGNLPSYYLDVQSEQDVSLVFQHAQKHKLPLSIKNSGHTMEGDSSSPSSLVLWTQHLKKMEHHDSFVLDGCDSNEPVQRAITTGAGVSCGEVYKFAEQNSAMIVCGYSPSVGISGGWVQNGGHSIVSNVYGLGVDRVLQFKVVTPDGKTYIANKCQNTDLFWALRGGGGGTFGVVMESTHQVEPAAPISVAAIHVPSTNEAVGKFMDKLVDTAVPLAKAGWGGHIYGNMIIYVNPLFTSQQDARASIKDIEDFALANGGSSNITVSPTFYSFFQDYVLSTSYSVGKLTMIGTQLTPVKLFSDESAKADLKSFFYSEIAKGNYPYIPVDSPYIFQRKDADATSTNPAWYSTLWEVGISASFAWNGTFEERKAAVDGFKQGTKQLQKVTLGGAAYKNEADPLTPNWREVWYGVHYDRLVSIKEKYDPNKLLKCWGCIGWTDEDARESSLRAFI